MNRPDTSPRILSTREGWRRGLMSSRAAVLATAVALCLLWLAGGDEPGAVSAQTTPVTERPTVTSDPVDGYMVLAPSILRSGMTEEISVSLFSGQKPARGDVKLTLLNGGTVRAESTASIEGTGSVPLSVPNLPSQMYELKVEGPGFEETAWIRVKDGDVLFVETDKPVYKPGQDINIRVLLLDVDLKPRQGRITVEVQDAKGTRVFRELVEADEFGMANVTMPLSTEPNLGDWRISAYFKDRVADTLVNVEHYVLPKYEIDVDFPNDWTSVGEPITGTVSAEYSFGKPVKGKLKIVASKYTWRWVEFAEFTADIDGTASFELPETEYISSGRGPDGTGNVSLEVTVEEQLTGHVETTHAPHTVVHSEVNLQLIPEGSSFKPTLPFTVLLVTNAPDDSLIDQEIGLETYYFDEDLAITYAEESRIESVDGKALLSITPPEGSVAVALLADSGGSYASTVLRAVYSPTDSFVHLVQVGDSLSVGDRAQFKVHSTEPSGNFHYEVISRGRVVLSDVSASPDIGFDVTSAMADMSRLVVYQVMSTGEVAADYLPFEVSQSYPLEIGAAFDSAEALPGDEVEITLTTDGPAKVGLAAVDRSVYALGDNRVNLRQVFKELERFGTMPRFELDDDLPFSKITTLGAWETLTDAGLLIITDREVPGGQTHFKRPQGAIGGGAAGAPALLAGGFSSDELADVLRVRQYFPETWLWTDLMTDETGNASLTAEAPDSITTWMLRAVGLSKEHGLGITEAQLRVFQPFFMQADLPYSAIRGEEFSVNVALHNYLDSTQEFFVELEETDGFTLLDDAETSVSVGPNDLGIAQFRIRLTELGSLPLKVTARSTEASDAVIKELLVVPEGVPQEIVTNRIVPGGDSSEFANAMPPGSISGSARTHVAVSGSILSQTLEGLENLLRMSYGCGEQNMLNFAPNVFVARYLDQTGQLRPELMARAEHLMLTGYQRQLMFLREDGSFATWGDRSPSGNIWLTAFVLKTLSQAREFIDVDYEVLSGAAQWILDHQNDDGSFEEIGGGPNGYLYGGLEGATALATYMGIALLEAGYTTGANLAIGYLESQLDDIESPYTMALVAYTLELGESTRVDDAYDELLAMGTRDENGLYWDISGAEADSAGPGLARSTAIENTGYAALALLEHGDQANAADAIRWLVSQRNAHGGFRSTQDTVVGLQALFEYSVYTQDLANLTVTLTSGDWNSEVTIDKDNADVVQVVSVPVGEDIRLAVAGVGEAVVQVVQRYNLPEAQLQPAEIFTLEVDYSAESILENEVLSITSTMTFDPPSDLDVGMVVIDIAIPTGFSPIIETVEALVEANPKIWRYDLTEGSVVLYLEDLEANETIGVKFDARAGLPIMTQPVVSQVYSYYNPRWRAESLGPSVIVGEDTRSVCVIGGAVTDGENNDLISDCEALLEARDTLAGTASLNWSEETAIADWEGVTLQGTPERVASLSLVDSGLDGAIPASLGGLTGLTQLNLRSNELSGSIPAELNDLSNLRVLNLHSNELTGAIPDLSGMTLLEQLYLPNNSLDGAMPDWLGDMTNLRELWLWGNRLSDPIPDLSGMTSLNRLKLQDNLLTGGVPAWFGQMTDLRYLYLNGNALDGVIPTELGETTNLRDLWLHDNRISGEIPSELGGLANLEQLYLSENRLTGTIPPELDNLADTLTQWRLAGNRFTGCVPAGLAGVEDNDLDSMDVDACSDS